MQYLVEELKFPLKLLTSSNFNAAMAASISKHPEVTIYLVNHTLNNPASENKLNLAHVDEDDNDLLMVACKLGTPAEVQILIDTKKFDYTKVNQYGRNCFLTAVVNGNLPVIKHFIESDSLAPSLHVRNEKTPNIFTMCANHRVRQEVVAYLADSGKYQSEQLSYTATLGLSNSAPLLPLRQIANPLPPKPNPLPQRTNESVIPELKKVLNNFTTDVNGLSLALGGGISTLVNMYFRPQKSLYESFTEGVAMSVLIKTCSKGIMSTLNDYMGSAQPAAPIDAKPKPR